MTEYIGTGATEAIRIAEKFLPRASWKRKRELALEISDAISLCESELSREIASDLEKLIARVP